MLRQKISPELFVAVVGSVLILVFMGALSYASSNYAFLFAGLMTVAVSIPIAIHGTKL